MRTPAFLAAVLALCVTPALAAERLGLTVRHELPAARPAETIAIPWAEIRRRLPGARMHQLVVRDAGGRELPYQVTNLEPLARDPLGELLFQHDFAAGEQSARFSVEKAAAVVPPFAARVAARHVPERLDDFAWENDRIARRTYGPALAAPAPPGSGKEVLVSSGLDLWFKRVAWPVIDRWYAKGHDHYHRDEGEGLDMYAVGRTRGAGGTGIWRDGRLFVSGNYARWRILANGPIRAVFELHYAPWDADGVAVSEVKRFTVDAGHVFDQVESSFQAPAGHALQVAVGLNRKPADAAQRPDVSTQRGADTLVQWVRQRSAGDFGVAVILPGAQGHAADADNELILAIAPAGQPLRYHLGAVVSWSGEAPDAQAWRAQVEAYRARLAAPVRVELDP